MQPMIKNTLEIYKGDPAHVEIFISVRQPEGNYHYIPEEDDEIKLRIYKGDTTIKEVTADITNTENAYFHITTSDIAAGEYLYDITLKVHADNEIYHIITAEKIIIRR